MLSVVLTLIWEICGLCYLVKYYPICFREVGVSQEDFNNDKHIWNVALATIISLGPLVTFNYYTYFFLCSFFFVYWFYLLYSPSLISELVVSSELFLWSQITHWLFVIPVCLLIGYQLSSALSLLRCQTRRVAKITKRNTSSKHIGRSGSSSRARSGLPSLTDDMSLFVKHKRADGAFDITSQSFEETHNVILQNNSSKMLDFP